MSSRQLKWRISKGHVSQPSSSNEISCDSRSSSFYSECAQGASEGVVPASSETLMPSSPTVTGFTSSFSLTVHPTRPLASIPANNYPQEKLAPSHFFLHSRSVSGCRGGLVSQRVAEENEAGVTSSQFLPAKKFPQPRIGSVKFATSKGDDKSIQETEEEQAAFDDLYPSSLPTSASQLKFTRMLHIRLLDVLRERRYEYLKKPRSLDTGPAFGFQNDLTLPKFSQRRINMTGPVLDLDIRAMTPPSNDTGSIPSPPRLVCSGTQSYSNRDTSWSSSGAGCNDIHEDNQGTKGPEIHINTDPEDEKVLMDEDIEDASFSLSQEFSNDESEPCSPDVTAYTRVHVFGVNSSAKKCRIDSHAKNHPIPFHTPSVQGSVIPVPQAPKKAEYRIQLPLYSRDPTSTRRKRNHDQEDGYLGGSSVESGVASQESAYIPYISIKTEESESQQDPLSKRRKISSICSLEKPAIDSQSKDEETDRAPRYSQQSKGKLASLRKAASLRSELSVVRESGHKQLTSYVRKESSPSSPGTLSDASLKSTKLDLLTGQASVNDPSAPTRPATPCLARTASNLPSPLPILYPPIYEDIPKAPLSADEAAEKRINWMRVQELEQRIGDGLGAFIAPNKRDAAEDEDEDEGEKRGVMIELAVTDVEDSIDSEDDGNQTPPDGSCGIVEGEITTKERYEDIEINLGVDEDFWCSVIEWLLTMTPSSRSMHCSNLRAQLSDSPDTRWHAAHIFARYFLRVGPSPEASPPPRGIKEEDVEDGEADELMEGKEAVIWDVAVACLALTVKLHRDVLPPLYPVLADHYLLIAPHNMQFSDLELAQRDILSALNYSLGSVTPGAYIEELWAALPSLRAIGQSKCDWEVVKWETWDLLYDALADSSYLCYPVHLLTACAISLSLFNSIYHKIRVDHAKTLKGHITGHIFRRKKLSQKRIMHRCECENMTTQARTMVEFVAMDMRELLQIPLECWEECCKWLEQW